MAIFYNSTQPVIDISLNANDLTTVSWNNFYSGADQYKVKVDGIVGIITTSTSVGVLTVSPGLSRIISVEAYQNNNLVATSSKYVKIFDYVGVAQTWTVPSTVRHLFADVQGASGGSSGGLGGRAKSYISVNAGESLNFYCGGVGTNAVSVGCTPVAPDYRLGGFNGGGDGGGKSDAYGCAIGQTAYTRGASGGGASDIRRIAGNLSSRIIVAGGGGGSINSVAGGGGGGENGVDGGYSIAGPWTSSVKGGGATISGPGLGGTSAAGPSYYGKDGLIGIGGTGARFAQFGDAGGTAGGGGGGYYGGGGGGAGSNYGAGGGGGGGSGYIDPLTKPLISLKGLGTISSGYRTGNGKILVSWFSPNTYSDIVTSGLVLNLDAQNYYSYPGSGTTWTDLSGNGNNGTLTNGPTYSSANGGSIVFDGVDDYVDISGSNTVTQATFSVWLKRNGSQIDYAGILFNRDVSYINVSGLNFYSSENTLGYHWNSDPDSYNFDSGLTPPDGVWCMCVVSVTSTTATIYLCQSSGITTATNTLAHASTTLDTLYLGYDGEGIRFMTGNIAQALLYNRALSADEVLQNFNAMKGRFGI